MLNCARRIPVEPPMTEVLISSASENFPNGAPRSASSRPHGTSPAKSPSPGTMVLPPVPSPSRTARFEWKNNPEAWTLAVGIIVAKGMADNKKPGSKQKLRPAVISSAFDEWLRQGSLRPNIKSFVEAARADVTAGRVKFLDRWNKAHDKFKIYLAAETSGKKLTDPDFPWHYFLSQGDYMKIKPWLGNSPELNPPFSMESDGDGAPKVLAIDPDA
eukprot:tig00021096_g18124.t1